LLTGAEMQILKEIAELKRKTKADWGMWIYFLYSQILKYFNFHK
jgi:hypothetical protein